MHYTMMQESCPKDIGRAFGVLQSRWAVLRGPAYGWDRNDLAEMMIACVIMHNMIVKDEGGGAKVMNSWVLPKFLIQIHMSATSGSMHDVGV